MLKGQENEASEPQTKPVNHRQRTDLSDIEEGWTMWYFHHSLRKVK